MFRLLFNFVKHSEMFTLRLVCTSNSRDDAYELTLLIDKYSLCATVFHVYMPICICC